MSITQEKHFILCKALMSNERKEEKERGLYITRLTIPVKTTDLKE